MTIPKPLSVLEELHRQARELPLIDYEATRRALAWQERERQYADWITVGAAGAPGFTNGWGNAVPGAAWEPFASEPRAPVGFFRDRWGFVHLRGCLGNATITSNPAFNLPPELRPAGQMTGRCLYTTQAGGVYARYACLLQVFANGNVCVTDYSQSAGFTGAYLCTLDGFSFAPANQGNI